MNVEGGIQLGDLKGIFRRRSTAIVATWLVVALAGYWISMALPNEYESFATILVEPQSVDPELVRAGVGESNLNERLHIMTAQILSRPRLSRIIDELSLYEEESEYMVRQEVIDLMRESLEVIPLVSELEAEKQRGPRDSINQFRIIFRDNDPKVARDVAQRLANDFIEEHINERVKVSQKSLEFIAGELDRISQVMRDIEAKVAAVKAASPGRLPENLTANQRRLDAALGELSRAQRDYDQAKSDESFWRAQRVAIEQMSAPTNVGTAARKEQALELLIAEYTARGYTDKHPDVVKAQLELEAIRAAAAAKMEDEEEEARMMASTNLAAQTAEAERRRAELKMGASNEEVIRLQQQTDEIQLLISETPAVAEQLDGLEREYRSQLEAYETYIIRQQQASVQADMERRQLGEQFRVLESAFQASEPTSPNRPVLILLSFVLAIAMGFGLAIVLESLDSSVHSAQQLQTNLNLPVLASIPNIFLESDRVLRRRRRVRKVFAAVALTGFALVGGAANYVWVNGQPGFVSALLGEEQPADQEAPAGAEG